MIALVAIGALIAGFVAAEVRRDLRRATTWTYDAPRAWSVNGHGSIRTDERLHRYRPRR